jgi:hypothetical protein
MSGAGLADFGLKPTAAFLRNAGFVVHADLFDGRLCIRLVAALVDDGPMAAPR